MDTISLLEPLCIACAHFLGQQTLLFFQMALRWFPFYLMGNSVLHHHAALAQTSSSCYRRTVVYAIPLSNTLFATTNSSIATTSPSLSGGPQALTLSGSEISSQPVFTATGFEPPTTAQSLLESYSGGLPSTSPTIAGSGATSNPPLIAASASTQAAASTTALTPTQASPTPLSCPAADGTPYTDATGSTYTIFCSTTCGGTVGAALLTSDLTSCLDACSQN